MHDTRSDTRSDHELIAAHQGGDRNAVGVLVDRYRETMRRQAWATVRHHQDAEDVVSEATCRVLRSLGTWREEAPFEHWLSRVVRTAALDLLRRRTTARAQLTEPHDLVGTLIIPDATAASAAGVTLAGALGAIDPDFASVIVLTDLVDLDHRAVADRLGLKPATVRTRRHRALRKLAAHLSEG